MVDLNASNPRNAPAEEDLRAEDLSAGDALADRFSLLQPLGRGSMGVVFLARDEQLGTTVVLKMLTSTDAADAEAVEMFRAEAVMARSVAHPNVVRVFDFHMLHGIPAMTMEYLPGGSLRQRMEELGTMALPDRLRVLGEVAEGLHAVHQAGVIHRDIKPANILFGPAGRACVTDFGIAHRATNRDATVPRYTPFYASPEQIRGGALNHRADLYAMGALAYHLLGGQPPFTGAGRSVVEAHLRDAPPPLTVPGLPDGVVGVVEQCLAKDQAGRPQDALVLARTFRSAALEVEPRRQASVLFIDLVAYSAMATQTQGQALRGLNRLVAESPSVRNVPEDQLIKLPTGDGMALVFLSGAPPAWRAALDISRGMRAQDLEARMGLHHGSIMLVTDVNDQRNVTGGGINHCQRVMACGGVGQLTVSNAFKDELQNTLPTVAGMFHGPYGTVAKHDLELTLWAVCGDGAGSPLPPVALAPRNSTTSASTLPAQPAPRSVLAPAALGAAAALLAVVGGVTVWNRTAPQPPVATATPAPAHATAPPANAAAPQSALPPPANTAAADQVPAAGNDEPALDVDTPVAKAEPEPRPRKNTSRHGRAGTRNRTAPRKQRPTRAQEPPAAPAPSASESTPEPMDPAATFEAARKAMISGRMNDAVRLYNDVLTVQPRNADAHLQLGIVLALAHKYCEGRRHFQAFIRLNPKHRQVEGVKQRLAQPEYLRCN